MKPLLFALLACSALLCQTGLRRSDLTPHLNFEAGALQGAPLGWGGGPSGTIFADDKIVHGGTWAARLERNASSPNEFSTITLAVPVDFAGGTIEFHGWLKTDAVGGSVAFDNMQSRGLKDTHDWSEYSITLPLKSEAKTLVFGALVSGTGKAWVDDLQLLVDGKPIQDAPLAKRVQTVVDKDHEFDRGSGIAFRELSKAQVRNLAALCRVWGFLKYHHPAVVAGERHWDYELFRELPNVLAATDRESANAAMRKWIEGLGPVKDCTACASLRKDDLYMAPDVSWIDDEGTLGAGLSHDLQRIFRNRPAGGTQFYVSLAPGVGNPVFKHELSYAGIHLPDPGYQLLALFRVWNIARYWYPYRDVMGEKWDDVLAESIPKVALAANGDDYQREMVAFVARIHDTHANLWSSLGVRPPVGDCLIPAAVRWVEDSAVVGDAGEAKELQRGDAIVDLDGAPVPELVRRWSAYYADSNDAARMRDITRAMTRGVCGPGSLRVRRDGKVLDLEVARVKSADWHPTGTHDSPGPTFRLLSKDVAYLKLSSVKAADAAQYVESARGTKGLIIDIRNYPSEFVVFALGSLLVDKATEFARFTVGDLVNPGAFHWGATESLAPHAPHYGGKVVILVDAVSQSSAEYTAMAFRSAPGAVVVGSTTAGADGNVSPIPLPGGFQTMVSGIGVFYPDKRPTQRVGIVPDIAVTPTIAGIRAGRDEVLEAAIRQIVGPEVPLDQIESMAKPQP